MLAIDLNTSGFDCQAGHLFLDGTGRADNIVVTSQGQDDELLVTNFDDQQNQNLTFTCNQQTVKASDVKSILIESGGNNPNNATETIDLRNVTTANGFSGLIGKIEVDGQSGPDLIHGSPFADIIRGSDGNDTIFGYGGDDYIEGGAGNDEIHGGDGNDLLAGGAGTDVLYGDAGNDYLSGGAGNDTLHGGDGHDRLSGGGDNDSLNGNDGDDYLNGNGFLSSTASAFLLASPTGTEVTGDWRLLEASGLVVSRNTAGSDHFLWTIQDRSSEVNRRWLYVNFLNGASRGYYVLGDETDSAVVNTDWEDMAFYLAPDNTQYLYIADIGDNAPTPRTNVTIYRFAEPAGKATMALAA